VWRGFVGVALVAACAAPEQRPRPPSPSTPDRPTPIQKIDPHSLPIIAGTTQEVVVELYAQDAPVDWLLLKLADDPLVSRASSGLSVTGRLTASSRALALDSLLSAQAGHGVRRLFELTGTEPRIDIAVAQVPDGELALHIADLGDLDVVVSSMNGFRATMIAIDVPADDVLRALASTLRWPVGIRTGVWVFGRLDNMPKNGTRAAVDLWLDRVSPGAAADLLREVAVVPSSLECPQGPDLSARLKGVPLDAALDALFSKEVQPGSLLGGCQSNPWNGRLPHSEARLVGLAQSGREAAALVTYDDGRRPTTTLLTNGGAVTVGPTSVGVHTPEGTWAAAIPSPSRSPDIDDPDQWRLAATLRDGTLWRALLVSRAGAVWVSSAETDRVVSIEAGRVQLVPDDPDGPPITILMRQL
jgi:hypothetical protein